MSWCRHSPRELSFFVAASFLVARSISHESGGLLCSRHWPSNTGTAAVFTPRLFTMSGAGSSCADSGGGTDADGCSEAAPVTYLRRAAAAGTR